jgi:beta-lactamase class A
MKLNRNSILLVAFTSITSCSATYIATKISSHDSHSESSESVTGNQIKESNTCSYNFRRLKGFKFIRPLMFGEPECEGVEYETIKNQLVSAIDNFKNSGSIKSASVYMRDFDKASWMSVNPTELFHPGSLMKIPTLITFLKMEEKNPGLLNRKITCTKDGNSVPHQTFATKAIIPGKSYSIRELLEYMIAYSDNNATGMLHDVVDMEEFKKTYENIGLYVPNFKDINYTISAKDYSAFLKVLYNSSYLNYEHSEFAVELLSKCDFELGFKTGFPSGTVIAEKFGEWGGKDSIHELHESGFVYINGYAYLITIMTSGSDVHKLPEILASFSKIIYENLNKRPGISTTS